MKTFKLNVSYKKLLADTTTPVSIYLRLRDVFPNSLLLESSDYHSRENSMSYICCDPIAAIVVNKGVLTKTYPDEANEVLEPGSFNLSDEVYNFRKKFESNADINLKFITDGLFGYFTHEAVEYFEDIQLKTDENDERDIPSFQYHVYRYIIAIDHFKNELYIVKNETEFEKELNGLEKIEYLIQNKNFPEYKFNLQGEETSNLKDEEFIILVETMKKHVYRGDVFQIVPSRAFQTSFSGDEFNVYRALRSINPSPYLFYFDYGSFKIFGSSPEAQLTIKKGVATIHPIAGTFKRTGNDIQDKLIAEQLENDPKESSEHVMLVDLARNDLSRHCTEVKVEAYKEVQFYSHLIHLVSKVSGQLKSGVNPFKIVADTFPAGTLSGAPKYRAMELIDQYEKTKRSFYSGAIGFMGFNGDFNHAIMIRSFLSKANKLHYQAGAGIVADSDPVSELNEVNHKIAALRNALKQAEEI
ncbi:MAG TPA: anthranilate synthase component I family protein [Pelobium sp.]|nr:anthranilate synthase component I family protein [Pelobium sp.]